MISYSLDLRERVIHSCQQGKTQAWNGFRNRFIRLGDETPTALLQAVFQQ
jgi:hypothetical protein